MAGDQSRGAERRAAIIERSGSGKGWHDGDLGHGRTYAFDTTDGHNMELYYETMVRSSPRAEAEAEEPMDTLSGARLNVRHIDHLNLLTSNVTELRVFLEEVVGMRTTEMIVLDSGVEAGAWLTATNKTYDIAFTRNDYGAHGRFQFTYAVDREKESCAPRISFSRTTSTSRPGRTSTRCSRRFFSTWTSWAATASKWPTPGRALLAPDWQPIVSTETERKKGQAWGLKTIESFHTHGTPQIEEYIGPRDEMSADEADERSDFSAVDPDRPVASVGIEKTDR